MAKVVKVDDLGHALEIERFNYRVKLEGMARRIADTLTKLESGRVSTHDGFNLAANATDLHAAAEKIATYENLVRFGVDIADVAAAELS